MAKISIIFLTFFLFALIVMQTSSSSRMILEEDEKVTTRCPVPDCSLVRCAAPTKPCPQIRCSTGSYTPCCQCPTCC
ncbi:hypothetical protein MKW94_023755 [Papaver nudicaule]|uniref:Uncharacterized protein n=1 Tax=Papaver nudicaule TaxID=74823 RepID=A0AA41VSQ7_PAPNU|nr:hypothetical protein [Papaver nudicaule]